MKYRQLSVYLGAAPQDRQCSGIAAGVGIVDKGDQEVGQRRIVPKLEPGRVEPTDKKPVEIAALRVQRFHPAWSGETYGVGIPMANDETRGRLCQNALSVPRGFAHRAQELTNLSQHTLNMATHSALPTCECRITGDASFSVPHRGGSSVATGKSCVIGVGMWTRADALPTLHRDTNSPAQLHDRVRGRRPFCVTAASQPRYTSFTFLSGRL